MAEPTSAPRAYHSAIELGLTGCSCCAKVQPASRVRCQRCRARLHSRKVNSQQRTLALLLASVVCYIPANVLPVMYSTQLGQQSGKTILGGVVFLWQLGSEPIAAIIFIASVFVPLAKLLALIWLYWCVQTASVGLAREQTLVYRIVEFVGRWSMVDVFVVAILASLLQMGKLMSIDAGPAALPFAALVVSTMVAAHSFDTRLLWDKQRLIKR